MRAFTITSAAIRKDASVRIESSMDGKLMQSRETLKRTLKAINPMVHISLPATYFSRKSENAYFMSRFVTELNSDCSKGRALTSDEIEFAKVSGSVWPSCKRKKAQYPTNMLAKPIGKIRKVEESSFVKKYP